jgi:hypothetical protein
MKRGKYKIRDLDFEPCPEPVEGVSNEKAIADTVAWHVEILIRGG